MVGKARTATFDLPKKIIELIDSGMELGDADDVIFNRKNSKQKNGAVGILTKDLIDREKYYTHAIIMALIPFNNMDLY
jgi:non-canonical (house-cleaning) NTP pyrophosphatase